MANSSGALSSMTGFARGQGIVGAYAWSWEIKSVNAKGLDVRFRLPPGWDAVEVPVRKAAMERAIASLTKASDYGIADVTTAATFELGQLYRDFGKAILDSDRPKKLSALEAEQYSLLLEEQAFPFEEKAIEIHDSNLKRAGQGVTNDWVGKSLQALAQMSPGKYGKREQTPEAYDALQ